jgi:hypothetical protein
LKAYSFAEQVKQKFHYGEFSQWKEMENFRRNKVEKEYKILTGKDLPKTGKDPIKIDSKAAWDIIQAEKERRVVEQRRSTSQAGPLSDQQEAKSPIPWWAFWRRK